jgi:hypothetical protein
MIETGIETATAGRQQRVFAPQNGGIGQTTNTANWSKKTFREFVEKRETRDSWNRGETPIFGDTASKFRVVRKTENRT